MKNSKSVVVDFIDNLNNLQIFKVSVFKISSGHLNLVLVSY